MFPTPPSFDPFKGYAASLALFADTSRAMQTQWVQALTNMASQMPGMVTWKSVELPVATANFLPNEEQMRETFQIMADVNLNAWTHAATLLSTMPVWARWPNEVPGRVMADFFHQIRENPHLPANDAGRPSQEDTVPVRLTAPNGTPDDLSRIKGIGTKISKRLNALGIYHFDQIAGWTPKQRDWVDQELGFSGRVTRDQWVRQARALIKSDAA